MTTTVTAFYKFVTIDDGAALKSRLLKLGRINAIRGTILLAPEGINATISGPGEAIAHVLAWLRSDPRFADLIAKESYAPEHPFQRFKVKLKREIVTFGVPEADPAKRAGTYVPPAAWNALIQDPDVAIIDTRNAYEVELGTFAGAQDPGTKSFREFPDFVKAKLDPKKQKKVAMFCTGGIRCEKASAYLLTQGFDEVYHLKGGILKYLETVPPDESLWRGACFVFDERVALEHDLAPGPYDLCEICGHPVSKSDLDAPELGGGVPCPNCAVKRNARST
jgi:UPF0176 protein